MITVEGDWVTFSRVFERSKVKFVMAKIMLI